MEFATNRVDDKAVVCMMISRPERCDLRDCYSCDVLCK